MCMLVRVCYLFPSLLRACNGFRSSASNYCEGWIGLLSTLTFGQLFLLMMSSWACPLERPRPPPKEPIKTLAVSDFGEKVP